MKISDMIASPGFARNTAKNISGFATLLHNLILDVRDSYRPGQHRLRGPGPNWRTKRRPWLALRAANPAR